MKTYRVCVIDFDKGKNGKIVSERYAKGLKEAREIAPCKVHFSRNGGCFTGWSGNINTIICEC